MTVFVSPTEGQIQGVLRTFLQSVLPSTVEVIEAQDNRVPEPAATDFVIMTPIRRRRLETNNDGTADCLFTGSIAGNILTVSSVQSGAIVVGSIIFANGVTVGTQITAFGSGTGGAGTYTVDTSQNVSNEAMAAGQNIVTQPTEITFQLDIHSSDLQISSNYAQTISTMFRDDYAVQQFSSSGFDVAPLHADDPRQLPFINEEQQYETRWVVEATVQANQVISGLGQQFAGSLQVTTLSVEANYAP